MSILSKVTSYIFHLCLPPSTVVGIRVYLCSSAFLWCLITFEKNGFTSDVRVSPCSFGETFVTAVRFDSMCCAPFLLVEGLSVCCFRTCHFPCPNNFTLHSSSLQNCIQCVCIYSSYSKMTLASLMCSDVMKFILTISIFKPCNL